MFLHSPDLRSELDEFQRAWVYGRNGGGSGLPGVWDGLLGLPPERESWRVTPQTGQLLEKLMKHIGVSHSTAHLRFGDDWRLEPRALDAGPGWEDRLAVRDDGLVQESGRVRIYLAGQASSQQQRQAVDRAARREYQVLQGINHRGIVQAVQIREHVGGPAILFRHRASDLRLDAYLDAYGGRLTPEVRLDMVRQLAEAVRYAHNRSLYHRYPGASPDSDSSLLLGWAGWNHRDQAEALVNLVNDRSSVDGWDKEDPRFVPLLAGLQEIMPWVDQWYGKDDPEWGGNPAEEFRTVLNRSRIERHLSESDLRDWRPEKKRGGRRAAE